MPARSFDIRLIRPDEVAAVSALTVAAYSDAYEVNARYRDELARVEDRVTAQQVWVAVETAVAPGGSGAESGAEPGIASGTGAGAILGTVTTPLPGEHLSAFAAAGDMDFRMLAVAGEARGRGIGRALVEHCAAVAKDRGASRLVLHTGDDMHLAIALYERMGFHRLTEVERTFPYPPGVWYPVRVYGIELDTAAEAV